jgi:Fe-S-cluster containining protein
LACKYSWIRSTESIYSSRELFFCSMPVSLHNAMTHSQACSWLGGQGSRPPEILKVNSESCVFVKG